MDHHGAVFEITGGGRPGSHYLGYVSMACALHGHLPYDHVAILRPLHKAYTFIGRPIGGEPTVNDEADGVRLIQPADLDQYDIHPNMRQQIGDYLAGTYPYLG